MIIVSFACNDPDNGTFTGRVEMIEIHGTDGCDIALESYMLEGSAFVSGLPKPKDAPDRCDQGFRLAGRMFGCYGYKTWYGNWCWDATRMTAVDVLALLRWLRDKRWSVTEASSEFFDVFKACGEITPAVLHEALTPFEVKA